MKPFIEKLPLTEDRSFVAQTHRTPNFEVPWHQHVEYELILFTEGAGLSFIGNYVGTFEAGDVFFLGSNLPHTFQKSHEDLITSAVVVHFKEDFWGEEILNLPESKSIKDLLQRSMHGLKLSGETKEILQEKMKELETKKGFWRITKLCECLSILAETKQYITVSTQEIKALNPKDQERIDKVFHYTMENFKEPIQLSLISTKAGMSIPAFCNYFKKRTKKTYIDFVNEVRVGHACKLLLTTQMSILQICFECGFNTVANFNRQFLKIKKITPSQFRKKLEAV
jgi:AraC-like DNA-binding protein/quercetin dioxygenase-like cupin family protein